MARVLPVRPRPSLPCGLRNGFTPGVVRLPPPIVGEGWGGGAGAGRPKVPPPRPSPQGGGGRWWRGCSRCGRDLRLCRARSRWPDVMEQLCPPPRPSPQGGGGAGGEGAAGAAGRASGRDYSTRISIILGPVVGTRRAAPRAAGSLATDTKGRPQAAASGRNSGGVGSQPSTLAPAAAIASAISR